MKVLRKIGPALGLAAVLVAPEVQAALGDTFVATGGHVVIHMFSFTNVGVVAEPTSLSLILAGLGVLGVLLRRHRKR